MLTRTSVDCADRMVATRSSNAVVKCSSVVAPGYNSASASMMRRVVAADFIGVECSAPGGPSVDRVAIPPDVRVALGVHPHVLLQRRDQVWYELDRDHHTRPDRRLHDLILL